jgi:hypothetical protein
MAELSPILCGVAGEYFVAAELSQRGFIASITLRNTKGIDILVSNVDATRQVGIQVKTNRKNRPSWILNSKADDYFAENLFYAFVNLRGIVERPDYYIVPSRIVADHVREGHKNWLNSPGKSGHMHKDNPIRNFRDTKQIYLERWDLLGLG